MNIAVCLKQVLDPDISAAELGVDHPRKAVLCGNPSWVINIFDENALESALQLRDAAGGKITALCFGSDKAVEALRKALALRVDEAVWISNRGL